METDHSNNTKKIAIVRSLFNRQITGNLLKGAQLAYNKLADYKKTQHKQLPKPDIFEVPGSFEIPFIVSNIVKSPRLQKKYCGILTIGAIIKGDTAHFEYIASSVVDSLQRLSIESSIPIALGIITTYSEEQAEKRSFFDQDAPLIEILRSNKGADAMGALFDLMKTQDRLLAD